MFFGLSLAAFIFLFLGCCFYLPKSELFVLLFCFFFFVFLNGKAAALLCRTAALVSFRGFGYAAENCGLFYDNLLAVVNIDTLLCRLSYTCASHGVPVVIVLLGLFGLDITDAGDGRGDILNGIFAVYGA